jgi:hypothetical protein
MVGVGILATVATLSVQPQPVESSRVEVSVNANAGYTKDLRDSHAHTTGGGAELDVDLFVRKRLIDDDAPYSLQPFLQRASTVFFGAGGAGFQGDYDGSSSPLSRGKSGGFNAGFYVHLKPWLALGGSFDFNAFHNSYDGYDEPPRDGYSLRGHVDLGFRWRDLRFDVGYGVTGERMNQSWLPTLWYSLDASVLAVIKRRVALRGSASVLPRGAGGSLSVEGFVNRELSFFGSFFGGRYSYIDDGIAAWYAGGSVGVTKWAARHAGISFSYQPEWRGDRNPSSQLSHFFYLTLSSRD